MISSYEIEFKYLEVHRQEGVSPWKVVQHNLPDTKAKSLLLQTISEMFISLLLSSVHPYAQTQCKVIALFARGLGSICWYSMFNNLLSPQKMDIEI